MIFPRAHSRKCLPLPVFLVLALVFLPACMEKRIVRDGRFKGFDFVDSDASLPGDDSAPNPRKSPLLPPPPPAQISASVQAYDLTQFAGQPGYTLLLGFYDEDFGPRFRQAAEQEVLKLRAQGDPAFVFHSEYRSLVTLHLFDETDIIRHPDQSTDYGPRIVEVQKKFPHSYHNGEVYKLQILGRQQPQPQATYIVRLPPPKLPGISPLLLPRNPAP